jgi:hypothetical protein
MAVAPGTPGAVDSGALSQDLALEVLRQAQERVKAQLDAGDALNSKLTTAFGQAVTLSLSSFGAAALGFSNTSWVPAWLAVGLSTSGLIWSYAALVALRGLRPQDWLPPAFSPEELWRPEVLNPPDVARGYAYIALALQDAITVNEQQNIALSCTLSEVLGLLVHALWLGILAALGEASVARILPALLHRPIHPPG